MSKALDLALLLFAVFAGTAAAHHQTAPSENVPPRAVVEDFLKVFGSPFKAGLPDEEMQASIRPYLSNSLSELLASTKARENECVDVVARIDADINKRKSPDESDTSTKPPLFENTIFTSGNEAPHKYKILDAAMPEASKSMVMIEYTYIGENSQDSHVWRNEAIVILEDGQWKIDDFLSIPQENDTDKKRYSVRDELTDFPSCKNYFEKYEKDNTYRH